jgi:hypothetical protein
MPYKYDIFRLKFLSFLVEYKSMDNTAEEGLNETAIKTSLSELTPVSSRPSVTSNNTARMSTYLTSL